MATVNFGENKFPNIWNALPGSYSQITMLTFNKDGSGEIMNGAGQSVILWCFFDWKFLSKSSDQSSASSSSTSTIELEMTLRPHSNPEFNRHPPETELAFDVAHTYVVEITSGNWKFPNRQPGEGGWTQAQYRMVFKDPGPFETAYGKERWLVESAMYKGDSLLKPHTFYAAVRGSWFQCLLNGLTGRF
jgi:hypothetical protein